MQYEEQRHYKSRRTDTEEVSDQRDRAALTKDEQVARISQPAPPPP